MIDSCEKVVIAVTDDEGVPVLVDYLLKQAGKGSVPAIVLLHTFVSKSGVRLSAMESPLFIARVSLKLQANFPGESQLFGW